MPVSIYKLVYQDNNLRKLNPCNLKIGTYTADSIKIIGTMVIYLIHPDSKQPTEMTFHIASSEGSVLLSCNASVQLGLIHHRPQLDYLPPQASLITSKEDHPRSTNMQVQVQKQQVMMNTQDQHNNPQLDKSRPTKLITTYEDLTRIPRCL